MTAVHNSLRNSRQYSDTGDSDEFTETSQYLSEIEIEEHNVDHHTFSSVNDDEFTLLRSNEKLPAVATPDQKYSRTKVDAGHEAAGTQQLPMVAQVLTTARKSLLTCQAFEELEILEREREKYKATTDENEKGKEKEGVRGRVKEGKMDMDIGWPTDVEHVAHVTFDRYNGFLGLPKEYENEVPRPTPSARSVPFPISYIYFEDEFSRCGALNVANHARSCFPFASRSILFLVDFENFFDARSGRASGFLRLRCIGNLLRGLHSVYIV
jgi:hypothetical protein